jgi:PAS domain S-box-containing protein
MDEVIISNILDCMSDSLIALGRDGEVLYANRVTEKILGHSEKEIREQGLGLLFFTNPDNHAFNQIFIDTIAQRRLNAYREVDYHHPHGFKKRLSVTTSYLTSPDSGDGAFVGFVALFKDITEISRLRENEKRLLTLKQKLEKDRGESLRKVAMGVAHELRNPLVTIGGFARRIANARESLPENRRNASRIVEDVEKLEALVKRILEYCNLPAPRSKWERFSTVVEETLFWAQSNIAAKGLVLTYDNRRESDTPIFHDRSLLRIAIKNVLDNAIRFSNPPGEIRVCLDQRENRVLLIISDEGPGIKESDLPYVMDPFFSAIGDGPGMGLAIARRALNDHHGGLEIQSTPGNGATATIYLPVKAPDKPYI